MSHVGLREIQAIGPRMKRNGYRHVRLTDIFTGHELVMVDVWRFVHYHTDLHPAEAGSCAFIAIDSPPLDFAEADPRVNYRLVDELRMPQCSTRLDEMLRGGDTIIVVGDDVPFYFTKE